MRFDAVCEAIDVVTTFKDADQSSVAMRIGHLQNEFGKALKIFRLQPQRSYWIIGMRIETGAHNDKVRLDPVGGSSEHVFES